MQDKQLEYVKCFKDRTGKYFIENYLSTFDAGSRKFVPFKLFPRQVKFVDTFATRGNIIAVKPRQSGITTMVAALSAYEMVFCTSKITILIVGNKLDISQQMLEKIYDFLNQVPRWMWGDEFYDSNPKHPKNIKSIYDAKNKSYIKLFNGCEVHARSSGENAARGISAASIVIFDEAAFIQNGPSVYAQAIATTASVENAKVVMISTPNGQDQLYYQTYTQALSGDNNFSVVEFRWYQDPRYNRFLEWEKQNPDTGEIEVRKEETISKRGDIKYDEAHWNDMLQDGWKPTSPWFRDMCKTFNNDSIKIAQELEVSFLGSSDNVIPVETIEFHRTHNVIELDDDWKLKDPFIRETWIWKDPIPGHRYICGVDPSSGSAEDNTAIEIIDIDALDEEGLPYFEQVLEYYGKMTGDEIGEIVYEYATSYNNALLVVEDIGGWGQATILTLLAKKYPNIYYDDPAIKTPTIEKKYKDYNIDINSKLPGFHTNSVRTQMIGNLVTNLKNNALRIHSSRVITEMNTWVWKNGRADHMKGAHDDALMCLSMSMFVIEFSILKNALTREKNVAMIKSWAVNAPSKEKQYTERRFVSEDEYISARKQAANPFVEEEKTLQSHLNACLMLGGFPSKRVDK